MLGSEERPRACVGGGNVRVEGAVGSLDAVQGLHPHVLGPLAKTPGDPPSPQGTYCPSLGT